LDITAQGRVVRDSSGNLALSVSPIQSFPISPNDLAKELDSLANSQATVTVHGQLYKKPAGKKKVRLDPAVRLQLVILEIQKKE
jgi:hypothetical protein